jgi:hypothetical protein
MFLSFIRHHLKLNIYWPACRVYAKKILKDQPADRTFRFLCSPQFWAVHGFWPNFRNPERFSEKLWSRMLHDRDPLLTQVTDKLAVRDYVSQRIGEDFLVPLLWVGEDPDAIPFDDLPSQFIIKTNHGAGYYVIAMENSDLDLRITRQLLKSWLSENYCEDKYLGIEWGYKNIPPKLLIENLLVVDGELPIDYKFFCYQGHVEFVFLHYDRLQGQKTKVFDRLFDDLAWDIEGGRDDRKISRPRNFETMINVAESLSSDFKFLRVDLYSVNDRIYFSELTPYPGGIGVKLLPDHYDYVYGNLWPLEYVNSASSEI